MLKYIEDLAQGMDSKFIVFFRHLLVRQAIVRKLVALKIKHICIAGDVPSGLRGVCLFLLWHHLLLFCFGESVFI